MRPCPLRAQQPHRGERLGVAASIPSHDGQAVDQRVRSDEEVGKGGRLGATPSTVGLMRFGRKECGGKGDGGSTQRCHRDDAIEVIQVIEPVGDLGVDE